jgi:hypothetical protein
MFGYLSSGAGGVVLLLALEMLRGVREAITGVRAKPSDTHPDIAARLARFDTVAMLKPKEFAALKGFRTASARIMETTNTELSELLRAVPKRVRNQLRALTQPY